MTFHLVGLSTKSQVLFFRMASIFVRMAACHSGSSFAEAKDYGSSI